MDKQTVKAFLERSYPGWKDFMRDFIVPLFEGADIDDQRGANALNPDLLNLAKRSGISDVKLLAVVSALPAEFKVYDVTVSDRVSLQRNRVTVQQLIRKIVGEGSAFMVFHYMGDQSEWRFSFCQKIADVASNAKRHTFLLGEDQNVRTVTANFVQLHETLRAKGYLEDTDLIKCFDVEALSKEFFAKYKKFYEKFVDYASKHDLKALYKQNEKGVRDYIKKMMGRLVFLQFLQKKGWLGVPKGAQWGAGDRQFLQNLFKAATPKQKDAFLDEILEHIFFHALNDSSRADGELFDTKVKAYGADNGKVKVPYLNGGLFESDQEDDSTCAFPKEYFSNPEDAENNPGLLDFFSQYNFTIDENDPTEAEVGVDPEMLSCIFENLLEDNKDKGAYYTPKAIVEYMCRESLTAYLQTDAKDADKGKIAEFVKSHDAEPLPKSLAKSIDGKLRKVKICDPAIGSGAFPMGLLRELQLCRTALEDETKPAAEIKKEIIQNNIYGVDIEKGAVDIARLRFWLSLVVDEPTPAALPNLDFKIMQGNSLLESYKGVDLGGLLSGDVPQKKKKVSQGKLALGKCVQTFTQGELAFGGDSAAEIITTKMREYYDESDHEKKAKIMDDINAQVKGYIKNQLGSAAPEKEIDALNPQNDKFFLWHTWFNDAFANGGFDIVIANPPYINVELMSEDDKKFYKDLFTCFYKRSDIFCLFFEMALTRLSAEKGTVTFIIPSVVHTNLSYKKLRDLMLGNRWLREVCYTGGDVFKVPTVDTTILMCTKPEATEIQLKHAVDFDHPRCVTVRPDYFSTYQNIISIPDANSGSLFDKLFDSRLRFLAEFFDVFQGIVTGNNGAFIFETEADAEAAHVEKALLHPLCHGRDIGRYVVKSRDRRILYLDGRTDVAKYPKTVSWLAPFRSDLEKRREVKRGVIPWSSLQWPRVKSDLDLKEKILIQNTRNESLKQRIVATLDDCAVYSTQGINFIIPKVKSASLRYLVGLLNSRLMNHIFRTKFLNLAIKAEYLKQVRLPNATEHQQSQIISLVDKILAAKAKDAQANTSELEAQIDTLVYDLYGLTAEERELVESSEN